MKLLLVCCVVTFASFLMADNAMATVMEMGDAGETLDTAQWLPVDKDSQIIGTALGVFNQAEGAYIPDADMYRFFWGGGDFYVDTVPTVGDGEDTQLFLFDETGAGVWWNDDMDVDVRSSVIADPALDAGIYYLGISYFGYAPYGASDLMFSDSAGPNNPGDPLTHWGGEVDSGLYNYEINFGRPVGGSVPVPEPASIFLFFTGLVGFAGYGRKKMRN